MLFVNPTFLIALLAVIIPVLVHLFNFRQFKKVYFTNVAFLREIQQETKKQSRLKQWLILLSRILAVTALVFALAQPYIPAPGQFRKNSGRKAVSVYIDNSFSMETLATEGKLVDVAKKKAVEIAGAYSPSDLFQLMTNDFEGKMHRFTDREQFLRLVEEVQISQVTRRLDEVITRQNDLKKDAGGANMDAYIISDFQKSTGNIGTSSPDTTVAWFLVPVEASATNNLFIDTLFFESPVHQSGQTVKLHLRIINSGTESFEKVPVKLMINGIQKTVSNFAVTAGGMTEVVMPYTENPAGIQYGQAEITDYPVVHDDIFYFSYNVLPSVSVLCINESEPNTYFDALFGNDSSIIFTNTPIRQISYSNLFTQSFIILNSPEDISSGLMTELTRFVGSGGHMAIFPPKKPPYTSYNSMLSGFELPGFGMVDTSRQRIDHINVESDLYSDVFDRGANGKIVLPENIDLPVVNRYYTFVSGMNPASENLLELQNKKPFLASVQFGRGKIYLFNSPCDPTWNGFPKHSIFVPTLFRMAMLSNPVHPLYHLSGENVSIDIPADSIPETLIFKIKQLNSAYEVIPGITKTGTSIAIQTHDQIKSAGFYQVLSGTREITGLAFNYNRLESRLERFTVSDIRDQIRYSKDRQIMIMGEKNHSLTRQIEQINKGTPLWKWFVILTLVFITIEIALIRHFKI